MQIKLDNLRKFTIISILAFFLAGCSGGSKSSGGSNTIPTPTPTPSPTPTVNPNAYSLGSLPNGSVVYISESSFSVNRGEITSGTISISGGESSDASYQLNLSINPSNGPTQLSNPSPCIVAPKDNTSCSIVFNSDNVNNGTYTITVSYTSETIAQISHTSKSNTKITASQGTLPNTFTIIVTGSPPVVESGIIEILPLTKSNIKRLESTTLTVSLSNSQNITTPVNITVSANNSDIVNLNESTCNLTTMNNTCNIKISGKYQGSTSFYATASGYQSDTSESLSIKPIIAYITSSGNNKIIQCRLGESGIESTTCMAVTQGGGTLTGLDNPIGIASYNGFIYITNNGSKAYMQCKITGIGQDFIDCKTVTIPNQSALDLYNITINNNFAYFPDYSGNQYTKCRINTDGIESNSCTVSGVVPSTDDLSSIAFAGSYAYLVNSNANNYSACPVMDNMIIDNSCQSQTPSNNVFNNSLSMVIDNNFAYFTNFGNNTYAQCSVYENGLINLDSCMKITTITNKLDSPYGIAVSNGFVYIINVGPSKSYTQCRVDSNGINAGSCTQTSLGQLLDAANSITLY